MRNGIIGLLILLSGAAPATAVEIEQTTGFGSWCSPAQNGNGNVVYCYGVDPRAIARLNELLDRKSLDLQQKTAEANEWARRYRILDDQFEEAKKQLVAKGESPSLVQTAQDLLHEGRLDEARKIYDGLIASDEGNVDRAAQDHFSRASIFALQFRMADALPDYAKARQYRPDNPRYAEGYAWSAYAEQRYVDAERGWTAALQLYRELAVRDPDAYEPDVARTLNSLGMLYRHTNRPKEAEEAIEKALTTQRDLTARSPAASKADLAMTLNNIGNLYRSTQRPTEAESAYNMALAIRRDLVAQDPIASRPYLATTLSNLGDLYDGTGRPKEAEKAYREALAIRREVAEQTFGYSPYVADTLNKLGNLYRDTGQRTDAEKAYTEALAIYRDLALGNPNAYASLVDLVRTQLSELHAHSKTTNP